MGQSIAALLVISVLLTAVVVMFRATQVGNQIVTEAMRETALHTSERNNTRIDLLPYVTTAPPSSGPACSLAFWVKNNGSAPIRRFEEMTVLMHFAEPGPEGTMIDLKYVQKEKPGVNEWTATLPSVLSDSTLNDMYHRGVWDGGESLLIEALVDGAGKGPGTTLVVTPNGVTANNLFQSFSGLKANSTSTPISFGQTLTGDIGVAGEVDIFVFQGNTGQEIKAGMSTPSPDGNSDTYLELLPPSQSHHWSAPQLPKLVIPPLEAFDDDAGVGYDSLIEGHILAESGIYILRARSYASQTGSYELSLSLVSSKRSLYDQNLVVQCSE